MPRPSQVERQFVESLVGRVRAEDRAALARLRRGLGQPPGSVAELQQYVVPHLPEHDKPLTDWRRRDEDAYYLVASLFALHQQGATRASAGRADWWPGFPESMQCNLGASFANLTSQVDRGSVEGRFTALLNSHPDDLPVRLRGVVSLLRAHDIRVNWTQLLADIQHWDDDDRQVMRAWARAFWGQSRREAAAAVEPEPTDQ